MRRGRGVGSDCAATAAACNSLISARDRARRKKKTVKAMAAMTTSAPITPPTTAPMDVGKDAGDAAVLNSDAHDGATAEPHAAPLTEPATLTTAACGNEVLTSDDVNAVREEVVAVMTAVCACAICEAGPLSGMDMT